MLVNTNYKINRPSLIQQQKVLPEEQLSSRQYLFDLNSSNSAYSGYNPSFTNALKANMLNKMSFISFGKASGVERLRADIPIQSSMFEPEGVAIVGASSSNPNGLGSFILGKIINGGYSGDVAAIGSKGNAVFSDVNGDKQTVNRTQKYTGLDINGDKKNIDLYYANSLTQLPEKAKIDTVISVVPGNASIQVAKDCAAKGIKNLVVIANGCAEAGKVTMQNELVQICKDNDITLIGPNCVGIANPHIDFDATFLKTRMQPDNIGLFSQSGAMVAALENMFEIYNLGVSSFASIGNKAGPDESGFMKYFKNDPKSDVILAYLESINNPEEFLKTAIDVSLKKPVIVLKTGRSDAGSAAAAAHTGSAAGGDGVYEALFKRSGVIRATHNKDLFLYSQAFSRCPLPEGDKVAVFSNGGGAGVSTIDSVVKDYGLKAASFSKDLKEALKAAIPNIASTNNPVDTDANLPPEQYLAGLEEVLKDDNVNSVIAYMVPVGKLIGKEQMLLNGISKLMDKYQKPVIASFPVDKLTKEDLEKWTLESKKDLTYKIAPLVETGEEAAKAISKLTEYSLWKQAALKNKALTDPSQVKQFTISAEKKAAINDIIKNAVHSALQANPEADKVVLTTDDAMKIFNCYGLNVCRSIDVKKEEALTPEAFLTAFRKASSAAGGLQYPVVMKISGTGETLSHKSDVGGVKLNIQNENQLKEAYDSIIQNAKNALAITDEGEENIKGVQIQEMVKGEKELYAGVNVEGNAIMLEFGLGGTLVDILNQMDGTRADISTKENPITDLEVEKLITSSPVKYFIQAKKETGKAYRGMEPVDKTFMTYELRKIDQIARDLPVQAININPYKICETNPSEPKAVDGRIIIDIAAAQKWLKGM